MGHILEDKLLLIYFAVSGCLWGLPAGLGYTAWYAAQRVKWQMHGAIDFQPPLRCGILYLALHKFAWLNQRFGQKGKAASDG